MLGILIGLAAVSLVSCDECQFNRDCRKFKKCIELPDLTCVCKFGRCSFEGFFRGNECFSYEDCSCKNTPETCFCKNGYCKDKPEEKYECHKKEDCKKMAKCKGKDCKCLGNLCEHDCTGYTACECDKSQCKSKKRKPECNEIEDCVAKGKCSADKMCACWSNKCVNPWWANNYIKKHPTKNCRSEEDCNSHLMMCKPGKCKCDKNVKVNWWLLLGECTLNN